MWLFHELGPTRICVLSEVVEICHSVSSAFGNVQGGSNMTGTDFFFVTIIAHHSSNSQTGLNRF